MSIGLVVKNGGLICQMIVGFFLVGDSYTRRQILSAVAVTIGIIITVLYGTTPKKKAGVEDTDTGILWVPVALLLLAMFSRGLGNATSQKSFAKYGKHYHEVLFYQSAMGLPMMLLDWRSFLAQINLWATQFPHLFFYVAMSMILNYIVTKACAEVTGASNSVVLNLVLTTQRFVSIVFSATITNAPPYPPAQMWIGAILVVGGCLAYVQPSKAAPKSAELGTESKTADAVSNSADDNNKLTKKHQA